MVPSRLVLLGHPVAHSLSPRFQQAALDAAGLAVRYEALDVPPTTLAATLAALAGERAGGNVTIPHKHAVADACHARSPLAERVGAVNAFRHDDAGRLIGHNTDVAGARAAIATVLSADEPPARVVVLGAGGAAAAVLVALEQLDAREVVVAARTGSTAEAVVAHVGSRARVMPFDAEAPTADCAAALACADLVINATSIGLRDDAMPASPAALAPRAAVLDLVYRPGETAWVRAARAAGHRAEDGLRMLVEQGAEAFAWWFGAAPDRDAMWRALEPRDPVRGPTL
jgi:shikimate dehydrogenase